ncbi:hypothetical protein [uncultured Roseobacter sp.]|uniref:hypothetical protein n=1 Tax=uncultured Roseobacter sp. TaxID=114847 RepID=UPI0026394D95|nr:hypothetical protein [uncultured Roseobacter sp.]
MQSRALAERLEVKINHSCAPHSLIKATRRGWLLSRRLDQGDRCPRAAKGFVKVKGRFVSLGQCRASETDSARLDIFRAPVGASLGHVKGNLSLSADFGFRQSARLKANSSARLSFVMARLSMTNFRVSRPLT